MDAAPGEDDYRREALGAYAHDVRTPLTALRMVLDLARQDGAEGTAVLDADLARMAEDTIADIETLTSRLQDLSRIERGRFTFDARPCAFAATWSAALRRLDGRFTIASPPPPNVRAHWDGDRLAVGLAALITATDRAGDGSGLVRASFEPGPATLGVTLASGSASGQARPLAADFGFGFFHARAVLAAMGVSLAWSRTTDGFAATVTLPSKD